MADLEALKLKRNQLNARIQQAEALMRAGQTKEDNRIKVLVGAAILEQCRVGQFKSAELLAIMQSFLARTNERIAVLGDGKGSDAFKRLTGKNEE